jgi:NAD(P)H-hydrate epimerase
VADPDGDVLVSEIATPALATAGSGDVLSGAISAFLAGGCEPQVAAALGVAVHGAAGLLAERRIGRAGTIARDIANLLPEAMEAFRGERGERGERTERTERRSR